MVLSKIPSNDDNKWAFRVHEFHVLFIMSDKKGKTDFVNTM